MARGGVEVKVDASGLKRKMEKANQVFKPRALLKAIGLRHLSWITRNFDAQGGLVGGWEPLKPATIARKGSSGILVDTGRLKGSFASDARAIKVRGDTEVWVGTNIEYAPPHEHGAPTRGIPQRRMMPNKEEAKKMAVETIEGAIKKIDRTK